MCFTRFWYTCCLWTRFKRGKAFRPSPRNSTGRDFSHLTSEHFSHRRQSVSPFYGYGGHFEFYCFKYLFISNLRLTSSSATQGQLVGAGKSLAGEKKIRAKKKSRRRIRAPGDKVLTDSSKRSEQSWLLIGARKSLFFSAQSQSRNTRSRFVFSYTKYT